MTLFDLTAPLPTGTTVLEASAGTGKTFAIAALAARYVAEGVAGIDDLLLVTFSRAATAELRSRVRERLRSTYLALEQAAADGVQPDDAVAVLLADAAPDVVRERADRLADAFTRFDRAAIMTTHEFCHGMLAGLGILAPQTPQSTLVEDLRPLADEAAEDVYLRMFADSPEGAPFPFGRVWDADPGARDIGRDTVTEVAEFVGSGTPGAAGVRVEFAEAVRAEVARRKRERRLFSFDDQLTRLADALDDPTSGEQARARLAARFPVVLVDEFQDTDPTQWRVLRRAFGGRSTLVLIGDPKQAIYGFRGGDVHTYGLAVGQADVTTTLGVNHRSDPEVVEGVNHLFAGVELGDAIIAAPVTHRHQPRLVGAPGSAWERGVQVRALESEKSVHPATARRAITADLVGVVASLLADDAPLHRPDGPLRASDIAVLVRTNDRGQELSAALGAAGLPATFNGTNSVLASDAAGDWLTLLRALDQPRRPYVQRAYLTDFVGATVRDIALADDGQLGDWSLQVHSWARVLDRSGVPALFAAFDADTGFRGRLLARPDGERLVTDHRHVAELLHQQQVRTGAGRARDLAAWLAAQRDGGGGGGDTTRRRDTDADAVQVLTIHRAKGLQWPVVLLPEVAHQREAASDRGRLLVLPAGDTRILDVAGRRSPGRPDRWERWQREDGDEALRALYVGVTRAQSRVVTWWAHHWDAAASPLHRLLHASHDPGRPQRPALSYPTADLPGGGSPLQLGWLVGSQVACVSAAGSGDRPTPAASGAPRGGGERLSVRPWTRTIDRAWRRTSYSGLTAAAHEFTGLADSPLITDELVEGVAVTADPVWTQPSPMAGLPAGAAFGTLVHAVYEHTDATGEGWRADLAEAVGAALRRWPMGDVDADALVTALEPSFTTPLGSLASGRTLRNFGARDHLAEMDFEFGLDHPSATLADIGRLLATHLPADDLLAGYPARLDHPGLADQTLHGFLTGSIDSVLRLRQGDATEGFLVVDYKTNRLAPPEADLTLGHYTPAAMAEAMMANHYPLQALLYCVALHRFLRLRMGGYDPERHLGGVLYLFVRGMAGPGTPMVGDQPLGVFAWKPPAALVLAVSRLLAGGVA